MPQQIDVPGLGVVEFPDGMNDADMSAAIKRTLAAPAKTLPEAITKLAREHQGDSFGDAAMRTAAGALRGVGDIGDTLAQGITYAGEKGANKLAEFGAISPESAKSVGDWRKAVNAGITRNNQAFEQAGGTAGDIGRVGGQIVGTGPFLSAGGGLLRAAPFAEHAAGLAARLPASIRAAGTGAATGAGVNALTSSTSDAPLSEQVESGAIFGAPLGMLGRGIGRMLGAGVDRETAALARRAQGDFGIPLRADQLSTNPMARFAGSTLQRLPFTGLASSASQQQTAFNRALANTWGESADKLTTDVMARSKDRLGNVFETELPYLEGFLNPKVSRQLQSIADAADKLPADDARVIQKHIDEIIRQFTGVSSKVGAPTIPRGVGRIGGEQVQSLIARDEPLDLAIRNGSTNVRHYASQLKDLLLDSVTQTATGRTKTAANYVARLQRYDQARFQYKNLKTVEDLAEKAPTGDISPALLMNEVRKSFGNMAYGGGGDIADLARIGQRFLKEPPSSGTTERWAALKALGAIGGGLAGISYADPQHIERDVALAVTALAAARTGGAVLRNQPLARALVRSGLRGPSQLPEILTRKLPGLAPRQSSMVPELPWF